MNFAIRLRYDDTTFDYAFNMEARSEKVEDVLEEIFGEWNGGSGMECEAFNNAHCRSLSVGDYVNVNGQWYRCAGIGWKTVNVEDVDRWFNTMEDIRKNRNSGVTIDDERLLRFYDKRKAQDKLGMSYFS